MDNETAKQMKQTHLVIMDVAAERLLQDDKWGGPDHDDKHHVGQFLAFVQEKSFKTITAMTDNDDAQARRRLIQIAALAVAAVEMIDRYNKSIKKVG